MTLALDLGWTVSEFWRASFNDLTVALAHRMRLIREQSPKELTEDQLWTMLDALPEIN